MEWTHTHTHTQSTEISARAECPATQQDICTSDGWQTAAGLNQGTPSAFCPLLDRWGLIHTHTHTHTSWLRQEERLCWTSAALSPATSATCRAQSAPDNSHTHTRTHSGDYTHTHSRCRMRMHITWESLYNNEPRRVNVLRVKSWSQSHQYPE